MSNTNEIVVEPELTEEEIAEQEAYDKVYFADANEAPKGEVEDEEVEVDEVETIPEEKETKHDEVPETEKVDETPIEEPEPEDDVPAVDDPEQPKEDSTTHTIVWNGKEVPVSTDELIAMAQQGFDYTYKSQNLAQEKRQYQDDMDLLTRVKEGDKEALAQLSKQSGIDPLDLLDINVDDIEQGPSKPAEPFMSPQVAQLMNEVSKDSELYGKMQHIETSLPTSVVNVMAQDAETFYSIVDEVRSGAAEIVLPQVTAKLATLPELDRALVMNNPEQYKNFYLGVKQSMMAENTTPAPETTPEVKERIVPNAAEVGVKRSGNGQSRGREEPVDSMSSDSEYHAILARLQKQ